MKYNPKDIERLTKAILQMIEDEISKAGIFYRIFFRCKDLNSLNKKLNSQNEDGGFKYDGKTKALRDVIGIRVNLYFLDDLELVTKFIKNSLKKLFVEETIDENKLTEFKPTRINLVFKIPEEMVAEFREVVKDVRIDATFELQLRTVFSEGWHEVEHDLRYKCQNDWEQFPEMSRTFNGILAALETHEWSIIQLFERLSYNHYLGSNVSAMIRTKLRVRCSNYKISPEVEQILVAKDYIIKDIFKINRNDILNVLLNNRPLFPLTIDNLIFLVNYLFVKDADLLAITPELVLNELDSLKTESEKKENKVVVDKNLTGSGIALS